LLHYDYIIVVEYLSFSNIFQVILLKAYISATWTPLLIYNVEKWKMYSKAIYVVSNISITAPTPYLLYIKN